MEHGSGNPTVGPVYFGSFHLDASRRLLEQDGSPVRVGSRAFDILLALVERRGEVLSVEELVRRAWGDRSHVGESNLRAYIARLRKLLGDGAADTRFIVNLPSRGYVFVAETRNTPAQPATNSGAGGARLPPRPASVVGRDAAVAELTAQITAHRLVSVVGGGGLGKTTVALLAAHALLERFESEVYFVDLATIRDPALVPSSIATTLGFAPPAEDPLGALVTFLARRRLLLIVDSCEHLIDAIEGVVRQLLEAPLVSILLTSREALRSAAENVWYLPPLDFPGPGRVLAPDEIEAYASTQLFWSKALAGGYRGPLSEADAQAITNICRHLEGVPLAIELAAGRSGVLGIEGVAEHVGSSVLLTTQGSRTAATRHQTLQAMFDWSFDLLSPGEGEAFRRSSAFVGHFAREAAQAVLDDEPPDPFGVDRLIGSLVVNEH